MNQSGGITPLTWEQQEASRLRQGERLISTKEAMSRTLTSLVEKHGLKLVKAELAKIEIEIDITEWALTETRPYSFLLDLSSTELCSE